MHRPHGRAGQDIRVHPVGGRPVNVIPTGIAVLLIDWAAPPLPDSVLA